MSGEEHALQAIANLLEANGHQVSWFLRSSSDIGGNLRKASAFLSGFHSPKSVSELRLFLKDRSFDAAIVQNLYPLLSPSIVRVFKEFNIPVIMRCPNYRLFCPGGLHLSHNEICERCLGGREYWCVLRNCENNIFKSFGYAARNAVARISHRIMDNVDIFVVLSQFQQHRFIKEGVHPEQIQVLPNITPQTKVPLNNAPDTTVSFVGRISPEKGIEDFVKAASHLPEISFRVAGNHAHMPDLVSNAPKNIRWMGFLNGKRLDDFYLKSRILVFPSRWFEGFPNVITSAMAVGKPVIAASLGAVPEIVEHERTGLLFTPGKLSELIAAIKRLYANPDMCIKLGQAGRLKAETSYGHEVVYKKLATIIQKAISHSRKKP